MLSLWQMSLSASAVILATALLRWLAANRLPRRMYVALWDIALLSSLVPFRVPWEALARLMRRMNDAVRPVNVAQTLHPAQTIENMVAAMPATVPLAPGGGIRDSLTQAVQPLRETVQAAPHWLWQAAVALWLVGVAVLACALLHRWASCLHVFSEALPCEDQRVEAFLREHRLLRAVRVRVSGCVGSPLSYGLLRPVILLPAAMAGADDQTLHYVLTHEFMHIRAWDMLRKEALLLALCLHWFNPLAWAMLRLYSRDMELMCDERVVRRLGGRKAYCLTLLDMEARRSNLTMGTCFSVTGIEERIKVMKNRKHQGILSIALAVAILFGAAVGAMTGMPLAGAEDASPRIFFTRKSWETTYAKYEIYGLGYDKTNGTITYNGQVVRYFEDMWPIDEQGKAGTCFMVEGGTVDVYGVREYPEYIQRNPDGSFDPSGTLVGLREATKEEFDELTARQQAYDLSPGGVTEFVEAYQISDATVVSSVSTSAQIAAGDVLNVEWWTAEEYREWMEEERAALQELVAAGARAWTPSTGWFTWTQEKADEAMARYEGILEDIERGAFVSKMIHDKDGSMVLMQGLDDRADDTVATEAWNAPSVEVMSEDAATVETELHGVLYWKEGDVVVGLEPDLGGDNVLGTAVLITVGPEDERKYTPEEWREIMSLVEQGSIQWRSSVQATPQPVQATQEPQMAAPTPQPVQAMPDTVSLWEIYQASRMEGWQETLAPYSAFGMSCALDIELDMVRLYWNGREVRGLFDPQRGTWITEHTGNSYYPAGAKELIAVYENGVLTGLREADAEESAVWDRMREENANNK